MFSFFSRNNYSEINDGKTMNTNNNNSNFKKFLIGFIALIGFVALIFNINSNNNNINNNNSIITAKVQQNPTCNYAATSAYFYPIGGCESKQEVDKYFGDVTVSSFQYICKKKDVFKVEYKTWHCTGKPSKTEKANDDLQSFACDLKHCEFGQATSVTGCGEDGDCSECTKPKNPKKYNTLSRPYILYQCVGDTDGLLAQSVCEKKEELLTESFYLGGSCTAENELFSDKYGSKDPSINCKDDSFTFVKCPAVVNTQPPKKAAKKAAKKPAKKAGKKGGKKGPKST